MDRATPTRCSFAMQASAQPTSLTYHTTQNQPPLQCILAHTRAYARAALASHMYLHSCLAACLPYIRVLLVAVPVHVLITRATSVCRFMLNHNSKL